MRAHKSAQTSDFFGQLKCWFDGPSAFNPFTRWFSLSQQLQGHMPQPKWNMCFENGWDAYWSSLSFAENILKNNTATSVKKF